MAAHAGVTESDFNDAFSSVDDCYCAAYQEGLDRLSHTVAEAAKHEQSWLARVRAGLVALLGFFDDEPSWARLLVVSTPSDVGLTLEYRRQLQGVLIGLLEEHGGAGALSSSLALTPALTGELVAGGVFSVIRTSMLEQTDVRLVELAPSLVAFIGLQHGRPGLAGGPSVPDELARAVAVAHAAELPIRATRRTALVLQAIAQAPYSNNREVARAAGIVDEGQTSKLLARLERQGVVENVGVGAARGEPNAWLLTPSGRRAVEVLADSFTGRAQRPRDAATRGAA